MIKNTKNWFKKLKGFIPEKLPIGTDALDKYSTDILTLYSFPINYKFKNMIAMMIQHLDTHNYRISKHYFYKRIHKASANEVAYWFMKENNEKIKAEEAALSNKTTEAADDGSVGPIPT